MIQIRRLLCPIDLSDVSLRALNHAVALSQWYGSELTALFVEPRVPAIDVSPFEGFVATQAVATSPTLRTRTMDDVRMFVSLASRDAHIDVVFDEASDVHQAIVEHARALAADLIVMGSHGRTGWRGVFLGSVAESVLRDAPCPVMVIPPSDEVTPSTVLFKHLVCGVDFSESSIRALEWAFSLAEEADAHLSILHVVEIPVELRSSANVSSEEFEALRAEDQAEVLTRLRSLVPATAAEYCSLGTATVSGAADRAILKFAAERGADLIVMGARGHDAIDRFVFGSKTKEVIRRARCPVLTVH